MKLVNLLTEHNILPHTEATTREQIIRELVAHSLPGSAASILEDAVEQVLEREKNITTYVGNGVAMPHVKIDGVTESSMSLATSREGIEWNPETGERAQLIFLIITPPNQNSVMLQSLASLAKLCRSNEHRENLSQMKSPSRILKVIEESGVVIKKHIVAQDIMRREFPLLNADMIMREAAKALADSEFDGLPVVDEGNKLMGELSCTDLLKVGSTPYVDLLSDDSFLTNLEPFEEYFKKEKTTTVFEIMSQDPLELQPNTPITKVAHQMIQQKCNRIYITENGKLTGMIYISDIIAKIHAL